MATVAEAHSYIYCNGTLVYTQNKPDKRTLRILDLHGSAETETVVDIRALLDEAVPESRGTRKYKFYPIHYANDIVTCRYTHDKSVPASWLVVFHVREYWTLHHELESIYKLFVRNNERHLIFGTHSHRGDDGHRRWVLSSCNLQTQTWDTPKIFLMDMAGSDLGSTISFDIFNNYFYGLSNLETFDDDGADYSSYYYCFRFPLGHPARVEIPDRPSLWRRENAEGSLDDRWTSLCLEMDDRTGRPKIVESRKEWRYGKRGAQRTYYAQELPFPVDDGAGCEPSSSSQSEQSETDITITTGEARKPVELGFLSRRAHNVHPGDNSSVMLLHTLSKTLIRSYNYSCSTFLDVVDEADDPGTQRLRIRAGRRRPKPLDQQGGAGAVADAKYPEEDIERLYRGGSVASWPPEPDAPGRTEAWRGPLSRLLNPSSHLGYAPGLGDNKSLILASGPGNGAFRRLTFVGFDSCVRLPGLASARGVVGEGKETQGAIPVQPDGHGAQTNTGKGRERATQGYPTRLPASDACDRAIKRGKPLRSWVSIEPGLYQTFPDGLDFSF